ncbi:DUF2155 domain-containing protein [Cochlodiniinecator piscidefendens]|uniref:DUF2155 domain-containing protein n=1 Tax=Cochlodiniinecator piscidefendens TaxID=2715756 RepID=UPI00140C671D|nr:DUF2155 domain-containing protein [Cochlodiniinecator piscidefendens]
MIRTAFVILLAWTGVATAQDAVAVTDANGAVLRSLDKVNGATADYALNSMQSATIGSLLVTLESCRYPTANPSGDAFAKIVVRDISEGQILFDGLMVASSPALNALDHRRYDVWVLRCMTPEADTDNG